MMAQTLHFHLSTLSRNCAGHRCVSRSFVVPAVFPTRRHLFESKKRTAFSQRRYGCRQLGLRLATSASASVATPGQTKVGFLGIGIMGLAMTNNLLKAGYDVMVWNRSADKCAALQEKGAKVGSTPKEVAESCDIILAMLSDPEAALAVAAGTHGVAAGMSEGKGYVDVSTVDHETSQQIAQLIRAAGGEFLEAPVSGSKGPAEQGQLIFLTAGDEALFTRCTPLLDVMGKASFFLGEAGQGAKMKLVVNMVMGTMMASFAEGLSLAEGSGLRKNDVIEVIKLGAIAAPMFALKGPAMCDHHYPPAFPLKHQQKDLRLALSLADSIELSIPTAAAANEMYKQARAKGRSNDDFSAVLEALVLPEQSK